ncbi:hypothetical protein QAD02_011047 [Eretmocerus hayati]|uniref:Uncharacterized protein n=1 Tax=Eretmocerus hayati TaxID=131215 RepID=A0ACC2NVT3_9HYME|nr:hypothetical protein QAD02_011047 [Eretmocerus hayati]
MPEINGDPKSGNLSISCHFDEFKCVLEVIQNFKVLSDGEESTNKNKAALKMIQNQNSGSVKNDNSNGTDVSKSTKGKEKRTRANKNAMVESIVDNDILLKLVNDEDFGDIQIVVRGKKFRVHRILLGNQSKIFSIIFGKLKDGQKNSVSIDDVDERIFLEILRFIYFNKVHEIEKYAKELLPAAIKYSIEKLEEKCVETVSKNIVTENVIEYLRLADMYRLEKLRKQTINFIASNLADVMKSSSYNSIKMMKRDSLYELIQAIMTKLSENSCDRP